MNSVGCYGFEGENATLEEIDQFIEQRAASAGPQRSRRRPCVQEATETPPKPLDWKCNKCPKAFETAIGLHNHKRVHSSAKLSPVRRPSTPTIDLTGGTPEPEKDLGTSGTSARIVETPGELAILKCVVEGNPAPKFAWKKGGREVPLTDDRVRCQMDGDTSTRKAKAPFNVPGPPGPPKPLHTAYNSIMLLWAQPLRDGGTPITGYDLEKREHGTNAQWEKAAFGSVPDTQFKVTGVKQYHFYEFRVAAVNAVGQGEWSDNSVPIAATRSSCKPLITKGMLAREMTVLVGEPAMLLVPYAANPPPTITWKKNGEAMDVRADPRAEVEISDILIQLCYQKCEQSDTGNYSIRIVNDFGSDSVDLRLEVVDRPAPPEGSLKERTTSGSGRRRVGSTAAARQAQAAAAACAADEEAPNEEGRQDVAVVTKKMAILALRRANAEQFELEASDVEEDEYVVESDDDIPAVEHRSSVDMRRESLAEILDLGTSGTPARIGASLFPGKREERWVDPLPEKLQFQQQKNKIAELKCKYSRANAKVRWYKGRKELFSDGSKYEILIDKQSITLIINNPDPDDSGKYKCEANGMPTNSFVTVEEPPIKYVFLAPLPNTMEIYRTKQGVLTCKLNSARAPLVWQRDGKPIDVDDPRYQIENDAVGRFTLTIRIVEQIDQGMWTAFVNKDVTSKCQVSVVEEPRDFVETLKLQSANENENATSECEVDDNDIDVEDDEQLRDEIAANVALLRANAEQFELEASDVEEDEWVDSSEEEQENKQLRDEIAANVQQQCRPFVSPPGAPEKPRVGNVAKHTVDLSWIRPLHDGGARIDGYVVEQRKMGDNHWSRASIGIPRAKTVRDTHCTVECLPEKEQFEFRVRAVNKAGEGEPSKSSDLVFTTDQPGRPVFDLSNLKDITVRADETITFTLPYSSGGLKPNVDVLNNGKTIFDERTTIEVEDDKIVFTMRDTKHSDAGPYKVVAQNRHGKDSAKLNVNVLDVPGKPGGPIRFSELAADACTLHWSQPKDDGGSPLTNYVVERKSARGGDWERVGAPAGMSLRVRRLTSGERYKFRVRAENQFGVGEPLDVDEPLLAKAPNAPWEKAPFGNVPDTRFKVLPEPVVKYSVPSQPDKPVVRNFGRTWAELEWELPASNGGAKIRGYELQHKDQHSNEWVTCKKSATWSTNFKVQNLSDRGEYVFRVAAKNAAGWSKPSPQSDRIKLRQRYGPPGMPIQVHAQSIGPNCVTLTWQPPAEDGGCKLEGYLVQKREWGHEQWEMATPDMCPLTEFLVPGLREFQAYEFRVIALNSHGRSPPSLHTLPINIEETAGACPTIVINKEVSVQKPSVVPLKSQRANEKEKDATQIRTPKTAQPSSAHGIGPSLDSSAGQPLSSTARRRQPRRSTRKDAIELTPLDIQCCSKNLTLPRPKNTERTASGGGRQRVGSTAADRPAQAAAAAYAGDEEAPNEEEVADSEGEQQLLDMTTVEHMEKQASTSSAASSYIFGGMAGQAAPGGDKRGRQMARTSESKKRFNSATRMANRAGLTRAQLRSKLVAEPEYIPNSSRMPPDQLLSLEDLPKATQTVHCQKCAKQFKSKRSLSLHERVHKKGTPQESRTRSAGTGAAPLTPPRQRMVNLDESSGPDDVFAEAHPMQPVAADGTPTLPGGIPRNSQAQIDVVRKSTSACGKKNSVRCADEPLLAKAPFNVPGRPYPPEPLYTTDNSIMLKWERPSLDRGTPITDYELEIRERGTKLWEKATTTNAALWEKEAFGNVPDTRIKVTSVKRQQIYEFRVAAVNAAGRGEWSKNSVPIAATWSPCKPLITMGPLACDMTVLVGEQAKLLVPYAAKPWPKFVWSKNGEAMDVCADPRAEKISDTLIQLCYPKCEQSDTGTYSIRIVNEFGSASVDLRLKVVDRPAPPEGTLKERTASSSGRRRVGSIAADRSAQAAAAVCAADEEATDEVDNNEEERQNMAVVTKRMANLTAQSEDERRVRTASGGGRRRCDDSGAAADRSAAQAAAAACALKAKLKKRDDTSIRALKRRSVRPEPSTSLEKEFAVLLELCGQQPADVLSWHDFEGSAGYFADWTKIGEGAFGEVFTGLLDGASIVLKIMPFAVNEEQSSKLINGDNLKSAKFMFNELFITKALAKLSENTGNGVTPTFTQLLLSKIVRGCFPPELLDTWEAFKDAKPKLAENERPDTYADEGLHFMIIGLSHGGKDLEAYTIKNGRECYSIFYQIALSLAIAEDALEFEHRDLHAGNILVEQCPANEKIRYLYRGEQIDVVSNGVRASIIDFSISRLKKKGVRFFVDLSHDTGLFEGKGISRKDGDYQYDVYRMMKAAVNENWAKFWPQTNVLWMGYAAKKLFNNRFIRAKRKEAIEELFSNFENNFATIHDFLAHPNFLSVFAEFTSGK